MIDGKALISDDTQMTLFTAAGLLLIQDHRNEEEYLNAIARAYWEWFDTQTPFGSSGKRCTWLAEIPEMSHARAPGITCMEALRSGNVGTMDHPINDSKGNGGVMRVAPIGLFYDSDQLPLSEIDLRGAQAAAITHGHPLGYISAAGLVHIVQLLSHHEGITVLQAAEDMIETIPKLFPNQEAMCMKFCDLMRKAVQYAQGDLPDLPVIHILGKGAVGEEALAISIFCALRHENDFDAAMIASVNHGGDSDSTGAITGNILGAKLGIEAIPSKYTENLELMDAMKKMAKELAG